MCKIIKHLRRKTATMYKVVVEIAGNYYSFFAGMKIAIGKVDPDIRYVNPLEEDLSYKYDIRDSNKKLIKNFIYEALNDFNYFGKISGFEKYHDAFKMANSDDHDILCRPLIRILKIKIAGDIWNGDATGIGYDLSKEVTLFGTEILEFKETKFRFK